MSDDSIPETPTVGRPTLYEDAFALQAEKLCVLGATDDEIADFFEVSVRTIHRWKHEHEEFCHSLTIGKEAADNRVERSLYQKATGYTYVEQEAFKIKRSQHEEQIEVVDISRFAPADTGAIVFWLKNRKGWRDKQEMEHTADGPLADLLARIATGGTRLIDDGNDQP